MKFFAIIPLLMSLLTGCEKKESAERFFSHDDFIATGSGIPNEMIAEKTIEIGKQLTFPIKFTVTGKGNGGFDIPFTRIRAYDAYNETEMYPHSLASVYFIDLNNDGYRDLVVCASKEVYDEKGIFQAYRPEFSIYIYHPEHAMFHLTTAIFDPFSLVRNYYNEIENPECRIVLTEKYRRNTAATSDVSWIDADQDGKPDEIVYSLKKDIDDTLYCAITLRLSGSEKSFHFSSQKQ